MHTCVLCRKKFEGENPAALYVTKYGYPKYLCPECEELLDKAASGEEGAEEAKAEALRLSAGFSDPDAMKALCAVLAGEGDTVDEAIEEEYERLRQTEEEAAEEAEEEEAQRRKENSFLSWLPVILVGVGCLAFLIWSFFFR